MTPALSRATAAVKYDVEAAGMLNPQAQKWIICGNPQQRSYAR
jgi:hypothetical protein